MALKKIIIHSNAPTLGSGYGVQAALLAPRLQALGYEVVISSFAGLQGSPMQWNGITVMPSGQDPYGADVIPAHAHHFGADLVITLLDVWALDPGPVAGVPMACWLPLDADKLGDGDRAFLEKTGAIPIAMSRHGEGLLKTAGFSPLFVPHMVDTSVFTPRADRNDLRDQMGLTGRFAIGILAANKDAIRKSFFPQFEAFAQFRRLYCPEAILLVHSLVTAPGALDLQRIAEDCGIRDAVVFPNQFRKLMGIDAPVDVAAWLSSLDLLSNASMGEGFGIAPLEALACGVPSVATNASAMPELSLGPDWLVDGEPFWNPTHAARWITPTIHHECPYCGRASGITERYRQAYELLKDDEARAKIRTLAREKALQYDVNVVMARSWQPALEEIERRLAERQAVRMVTPPSMPAIVDAEVVEDNEELAGAGE